MPAILFRVCGIGLLLCAAGCLLGIDYTLSWAAEYSYFSQLDPPPANEMTPLPEQNGKVQEGQAEDQQAIEEEEDDCEEFCGFPCCTPPGKLWLRADYLMWWTNGIRLPPLVTTSPQGTTASEAGVLGYPNTTILFGDQTVANDGRAGIRITMGMWLDNCHNWGIEVDYFTIGEKNANFNEYSTGDPILARPLYNVQTIAQSRELVAYPDIVEGRVTADAKDYFQGTGVWLTYNLCCNECGEPCCETADECCCAPPLMYCCRTDLLVGFRYYKHSSSVLIREDLRVTQEGPTENWLFDITDNFRARNDFYGSELGLRTRVHRGRWSLEMLAKVAVGNTRQVITIEGQTIVTPTDQPTEIREGGVFAVRSNMGTYNRDAFTMIPQLGVEVGYQLNCNWRAYMGYNLLYWGCIAQAADQIDLYIDPRNIPPTQDPALPFPAFSGKTSCFWAQGANVGLECRF